MAETKKITDRKLSEVGLTPRQLEIALHDFRKVKDVYTAKIRKLCKKRHRCIIDAILNEFAGRVVELTREFEKENKKLDEKK